jgi:hypothetical protein
MWILTKTNIFPVIIIIENFNNINYIYIFVIIAEAPAICARGL